MIEGNDAILGGVGLIDKRQFHRVLFEGDLSLLAFEDRYSFFALGVTEYELPQHQKTHPQVNQNVSTSVAEQQQQASQKNGADDQALRELPNNAQARVRNAIRVIVEHIVPDQKSAQCNQQASEN
ncbi:MAG: hypothetical protein ACOVQM_09495, partial [Pirellula sp.]